MKVFYLHLNETDFVQDDNSWLSERIIDLYENDSYTNYSATKSDYGLNSLGDRTWTGMESTGPGTTDSGRIDGGRFIDHSGRIDLMSQSLLLTDLDGTADVSAVVHVYGSDNDAAPFPEQWALRADTDSERAILWIGAYRYVRFEIEFVSDQEISAASLTYDVRVEIDRPVMAPLYRRTRAVLNKFPEWMKLREDSVEPATPALAEPVSLAAQLLNAAAGQWLDDIDNDLTYLRMQRYIATADPNQTAWIYYTSGVPTIVWSVTSGATQLSPAADLEEFYETDADDNVYWWDEFRSTIYVHTELPDFEVNGEPYELTIQQIWNWFDEHGASIDLYRHHAEGNDSFRKRILDVYINQPGVTLDRFKLALRRELNMWAAESPPATPNSEYLGATPEVLEISDIEVSNEFVAPDGMPTAKFKGLVSTLAELYPVTWGYFRWNKALWDIGGKKNEGFGVLPYRYDATPVDESQLQSGIGDGSDLYLYRPDDITGPREFEYRLKIRGRQRSTRTEYPKVTVYADVYGQADKTVYNNPTLTPWATYSVQYNGVWYHHSFQATVTSDVNNDTPAATPNSYFNYTIVGPDGLTSLGKTWYDAAGNQYTGDEATPFQIDIATATANKLQWGKFNPVTKTFGTYPTAASATLWYGLVPGTTLAANSSNTFISHTVGTLPSTIVIRSNQVSSSVQKWESDHEPYVVEINGGLPDNAELDVDVAVPEIMWDPYLQPTPNKEIVVEITLVDHLGNFVVNSTDAEEQQTSLPHTIISINGDNTWAGPKLHITGSTSVMTFSVGTNGNPAYPVVKSVWELFEAVQNDTAYAVADENGPWRNGVPQEPGAFNFLLTQADVGRPDFGLSNSDDYVVTWIGVEVLGTNRVIAWLDTNVVDPATDDDNVVVYPPEAIAEEWSSAISNYVFEPFFIRARLRPEIEPQWYPQIHSGWFYEKDREQYLYANPVTETTGDIDYVLADVARQGAPIIVHTDEATPVEYRQIAFFDDATPELRSTNKETVYGSGVNSLFVAFEDIFDIVVTDLDTGLVIPAATETSTNEISTTAVTSKSKLYEVEYKVDRSFYVDHEHVDDGANKTRVTIVENNPFGGDFNITYEGSDYDPATPVDLPLNTFYTVMSEGFVFLSHDEYGLKYVEVTLSPSKFLADGEDYILMAIKSYDLHMNPKGDQTFTLTTNYGTFESTGTDTVVITTDDDGFATTILMSEVGATTLLGEVTIDGPGLVDAVATFEIEIAKSRDHRLVALPSTENMPADGESIVYVYGKVEDSDYVPVPYAEVAYKRGRSMEDAFTTAYQGQVKADEEGVFIIGPITAATPGEPGYWFMVLESWEQGASPSGDVATPDYSGYGSADYGPVGDVVFWNEHPDFAHGVNEANELPQQAIQMEGNSVDTVYYSNQNAYPVTYDDATPYDSATPVTLEYTPPAWYAINRYTQYQLGLLGTGFYSVDLSSLADAPPEYKDL